MIVNKYVWITTTSVFIVFIVCILLWQFDAESSSEGQFAECEKNYVPKDYAYMHATRIDFMDDLSLNTMDVGHVSDMLLETFKLFRFTSDYDVVKHPRIVFSSDTLHDCTNCLGIYGSWKRHGYCNATIFLRNHYQNDPDFIWSAQKTLLVHEYAHHVHHILKTNGMEPTCVNNLWHGMVSGAMDFSSSSAPTIDLSSSYARTNPNEFFACTLEMYAAQPSMFPDFESGSGSWVYTGNLFTWAQLGDFEEGILIRDCVESALTNLETIGARHPTTDI
tara:strand:+ start:61 stop:891 length:831 start_codon:yes stop_codon:yes gene_type:complete